MNKREFMVVMDAIRSYYPREKIIPTKEAAELWYNALKDLDFDMAMASVQKHTMTSKWSPTISEIRASAVSITSPQEDWSDGWESVLTAVRRFGYCNEKEALASMDEQTRTVVKRLGWKQICMTEQEEMMALRANFRMIYEQKQKKTTEEAKLPSALKERIAEITSDRIGALLG